MKIAGVTPTKHKEVMLVFDRNNEDGTQGEPIVLRFQPVTDFARFYDLVKEPKAPLISRPGKPDTKNEADPKYIEASNHYYHLQTLWVMVESLKVTEDLEFETWDPDDPLTWVELDKEMEECFHTLEILKIVQAAQKVTIVTDASLEAARERFLAKKSLLAPSVQSSLQDGLENIRSGGLVNDGGSDLPASEKPGESATPQPKPTS